MKKIFNYISILTLGIIICSCYEDPVAVYQFPIKNYFITFETEKTDVDLIGYNACIEAQLRIVPEHVDSLKYGVFEGTSTIQKLGSILWKDFKQFDNTYFVGDVLLNTTYKQMVCIDEAGTFRILLPIRLKQTQMDTLISNSFTVNSYGINYAEASVEQNKDSKAVEITVTNNLNEQISLKYYKTENCLDVPCSFFLMEGGAEKKLFWHEEDQSWNINPSVDSLRCTYNQVVVNIDRGKKIKEILNHTFPEGKIKCKFEYFLRSNENAIKSIITDFVYTKSIED